MLAGSFDVLAGKVIRIGHMGNNATFYNIREVLQPWTELTQAWRSA